MPLLPRSSGLIPPSLIDTSTHLRPQLISPLYTPNPIPSAQEPRLRLVLPPANPSAIDPFSTNLQKADSPTTVSNNTNAANHQSWPKPEKMKLFRPRIQKPKHTFHLLVARGEKGEEEKSLYHQSMTVTAKEKGDGEENADVSPEAVPSEIPGPEKPRAINVAVATPPSTSTTSIPRLPPSPASRGLAQYAHHDGKGAVGLKAPVPKYDSYPRNTYVRGGSE